MARGIHKYGDVYVITPTYRTIEFDGLRISLAELSRRTGIAGSFLARVFRGKSIISLWDARNVAIELNITLDEFASKLEKHMEIQRVREELDKEPEPPEDPEV